LLIPFALSSAQETESIHQQEWEYYRDHPEKIGSEVVRGSIGTASLQKHSALSKVVYGFHPYWMNGAEANYRYDLLTHLAYFSADVDPSTGKFSSTNGYSSATVITAAKNAGVKVHLTVVCFKNHSLLWAQQSNVDTLVNNILAKVNERNIDGVNIDFESMKNADAAPFKKFILQLGDSLQAHQKKLCVELFAVDWNSIFPASFFADVDNVVDQYFIMLYAYYYKGSSTAGPNAPLRSSTAGGYHVLKSINSYLTLGCPPDKLIAGFPYYGIDWPVVSSARMAATTGTGVSRTYNVAKNNYLDTVKAENIFFDAAYSSPWYRYKPDSVWRQTWYENAQSIGMKYDSVKTKNIAGVGMWALGYDGAEPELWNELSRAFTVTSISQEPALPSRYALEQNFPNPFNPNTVISYQLPGNSYVTLTVYDAIGREVGILVNGTQQAGQYHVEFNASHLASGLYFYSLQTENFNATKKMLLVK
jgi:spore germination protein YaaH